MRKLLFILLAVATCAVAHAQNTSTNYVAFYKNLLAPERISYESTYNVATDSGNFYSVGFTTGDGLGSVITDSIFVLFKHDAMGNVLWAKSYHVPDLIGYENNYPSFWYRNMLATSDGQVVVIIQAAKSPYSWGIMKFDNSGNPVFSELVDFSTPCNMGASAATNDGGFVFSGVLGYNYDPIVRFNADGTVAWAKSYPAALRVGDIQTTDNYHYKVFSADTGRYVALADIDQDGNITSNIHLGFSYDTIRPYAQHIAKSMTGNGKYFLNFVSLYSPVPNNPGGVMGGDKRIYVSCVSDTGLVWSKAVVLDDDTAHEVANPIIASTTDGGVLIVLNQYMQNGGQFWGDGTFIRLDSNGGLVYCLKGGANFLTGSENAYFTNAFSVAADSTIIITGGVPDTTYGGFLIERIKESGEGLCATTPWPCSIVDFPMTASAGPLTSDDFTATLAVTPITNITVSDFNVVFNKLCGDTTGHTESVGQFLSAQKFDLYPNPAKNRIHINTGAANETGTIVLLNIIGQRAYEQVVVVSGHTATIELNNLTTGSYIYRYTNSKNEVHNGLIKIENK